MNSFALPTDPPPASPVPSRDPTPRIVVVGGECTGKTTLAQALAHTLGSVWVSEYSRQFAEQVRRALVSDDVERIASGQITNEDAGRTAMATRHRGVALESPEIVLDTDLLSTTVYAEFYYGACPQWILQAARGRLGDLYLLCAPDLLWTADGVRDQPEARHELHGRFARRLTEWMATVIPIAGTGERRTEHALAAVRGWRAARRHTASGAAP